MRSEGQHPDIESLARLAEGRSSREERESCLRHLAACGTCMEVYSDTLRTAAADFQASAKGAAVSQGRSLPPPSAKSSGRARRRALREWLPVPIVAIAAMGIITAGFWLYFGPEETPAGGDLQSFVKAVGDRRFIEPRLSGGFGHSSPPGPRRGSPLVKPGDPGNWKIFAVAEEIRKRAEGGVDSGIEARALAATHLLAGNPLESMEILQESLARFGDDPATLSDLSATYLVIASENPDNGSVLRVHALDAAKNAIHLSPTLLEGWFNLALAVEAQVESAAGPGPKDSGRARKAWEDYLERDAESPWAFEARRHLQRFPESSSNGVTRQQILQWALEGDHDALISALTFSPRRAATVMDSMLLRRWSDACLANDAESASREHAAIEALAEAFESVAGDPFYTEISSSMASVPLSYGGQPSPFCSAVAEYCDGRHLESRSLMKEAAEKLKACAPALGHGAPALRLAAELRTAIALNYSGRRDESDRMLTRILEAPAVGRYPVLEGQARWMKGLIHAQRARLGEALNQQMQGLARFRAAKDLGSESSIQFLLAEAFGLLGDTVSSWRHRESALALAHLAPVGQRASIYIDAAYASLDLGLPWASLELAERVLDDEADLPPGVTVQARLTRAEALAQAGLSEQVLEELERAMVRLPEVEGEEIRRRFEAEANASRGRIQRISDPRLALESLSAALQFFDSGEEQEAMEARGPALHHLVGQTLEDLGRTEEAAEEYDKGIRRLEEAGRRLRREPERIQLADRSWEIFDSMIGLQVQGLNDPQEALAYAERARSTRIVMAGRDSGDSPDSALFPEVLAQKVPNGTALIYFVSLEDELLSWVLRDGTISFNRAEEPRKSLRRRVDALVSALTRHRDEETRRISADLYNIVIRPIEHGIESAQELVLIPDSFLGSLPFAVLQDPSTGRYMVEKWALSMAPSATTTPGVRDKVEKLAEIPRVLVVGNPAIDTVGLPGLDDLPAAEREAQMVAALHADARLLIGQDATARAFLEEAAQAGIIHFSGHALGNNRNPERSALVLAPEPGENASGLLLAREIAGAHLPETSLVILGGCRTAAGRLSRTAGAMSLARPFLAAGVPEVIGTLWDLEDGVGEEVLVRLHRALVQGGSVARALQKTQRELIEEQDVALSSPAIWGTFALVGGAVFRMPT